MNQDVLGLLAGLKGAARVTGLTAGAASGLWAQAVQRLEEHLRVQWEARRGALAQAHERLRLLSPENVLERGYSITMDDATGKVIRDSGEVASGQRIRTRLKKGLVRSVVEDAGG
jgi:exodeoxyribonuclease VII large subunit